MSAARWAAVAAAALALAVLVVAAFTTPDFAWLESLFQWMGLTGVLLGTAVAVEHLREIRDARLAEVSPFVDLSLTEAHDRGRPVLDLQLRNVGKGVALDVAVRLWWKDAELVEFLPHDLSDLPRALPPDEVVTQQIRHNWARFLVDGEEEGPQVVAEVTTRRAASPSRDTVYLGFQYDRGELGRIRQMGRISFEPRQGMKLRQVEALVGRAEAEWLLHDRGYVIRVSQVDERLNFFLTNEDQETAMLGVGLDTSIGEIIEHLESIIDDKIGGILSPRHDEALAPGEGEDSAQVNPPPGEVDGPKKPEGEGVP